ncbi:hypothetical protein EGJ16_21070 [Serratia marcescens]|nr:hypothetical protein EGJ16_21070 [Serratia marcescens]
MYISYIQYSTSLQVVLFRGQIRFLLVSDHLIVTLPRRPEQHNMCHLFSWDFVYMLCFTGLIVNGGFRLTSAV